MHVAGFTVNEGLIRYAQAKITQNKSLHAVAGFTFSLYIY